jgi:hypothetical protein
MPSSEPVSVGRICTADSPAHLTGAAPSAPASADERRASRAVAQLMKMALTLARRISITVMSSRSWLIWSVLGLFSAEELSEALGRYRYRIGSWCRGEINSWRSSGEHKGDRSRP